MATYQVAISDCRDYSYLPQAFEDLKEKAGLAEFEKRIRGKRVLVKPNMIGAFKPERAATTHPALVKTVVQWLQQAGAVVAVGDNCGIGGYGINRRTADACGILKASNGTYENLAQKVKCIELDSPYFKSLAVSQSVLECDFIVNLPKLKTHALTLLTLGVKNMFGILAGADKSRVHSLAPKLEDFGHALADIYSIRPPDLTIADGVVGMEGNGPTHGRVRPVGWLLAGFNAPALDAVAANMLGIEIEHVHYLRHLRDRGLGPKKINDVDIAGMVRKIPRFRLPTTLTRSRWIGAAINRFFYKPVIRSRLVLDKDLCSSCKNCVEICPGASMIWKNALPEIVQDNCIRCLCCMELCPEGAWQVSGTLRRLIGREI